ncbi:hypothetical protein B7R21_03045 [Subtercola boreus]|uniref:Uncharacterized protein n=1 Tax=Subtercola boreus TaxID=120213 RepID=A0A3E0W356_9MICO|nr:hypothetical protein [Subtercola boreus]RFA15943.1 hypothetical protein B7R21_03045 [Subtercola boreus]
MKNDRPKAIAAAIAFFLAGGAGAVFGFAHPSGGLFGGVHLIFLSALLLFLGVLLVVIVLNDPYSVAPGARGTLRRSGRAHVLRFSVGDSERHEVFYRWDQVWGWVTVTVDDVLVSKQLVTISFRLMRVLELQVGESEKHSVRIEKRRSLFFSAARPQPIEAFVDGVLVASDDGAAAVRSS